ncbi:MAG: transposase, partial [Magnetospirillum sp. WYHS-4]
ERIAYAREPRKLPVVLSADEVVRFLEAVPSLKNRTALTAAYAAGLRVSEVVALKVADIDSGRMLIRIERGKVLSRLFRRLFLEHLAAAHAAGRLSFFADLGGLAEPAAFARHLAPLRRADWVVYAKRPFGGPEQVLAYLGRYTHRVAIANSRLVAMEDGRVSFRWKDYRHHGRQKVMTLAAGEFIRRFLLHVLPDGFHRIRHFGFLANGHRAARLEQSRRLLAAPPPVAEPVEPDWRDRHRRLTGDDLRLCRCCGGTMVVLAVLPRRPAPKIRYTPDTS